jgi:hypothetical protein
MSLAFADVRDELDAVVDLLGRYFDGLYHSDDVQLADVLHPAAIYATATPDGLLRWSMPEYFAVVVERESPAARREARADAIEAIEFAGPTTASARVRCSIGAKRFVDLLSLIKVDGRWWVIAKVFHVDNTTSGGS